MSDRINCRNCIHFNDLEHRCCLNDGKAIKKECYFILSNRKPKGKDIVIENLKTKIADLETELKQCKQDAELIGLSNSGLAKMVTEKNHQLALTEKALELACEDKPRPIKYYGNYIGRVKDYIDFYKTKAKEMMKSE